MPILKLWFRDDKIVLDKLNIEDITSDPRTNLLDKKSFIKDEFKIDKNIYLAQNDLAFKLSKFFVKTDVHAILFKEDENHIIIVPSKSYVFWNGRSVDANEYSILPGEINIQKILALA